MLAIETIITFVVASSLVTLAPGPDNLFVLTQSMLHGRKVGLIVTLGICTGLIFHTTAVAFGLAVLFQSSAIAFTILKIVGAIYLVYLAWKALTAKVSNQEDVAGVKSTVNLRQLYLRGMLMNISNPKVSIFFLAFLPQFVDVNAGSVTYQSLILGSLFTVATFIIFSSIALLAAKLSNWFTGSPTVQLALNRIVGVMFLGFAFKLATSSR
ncbi:LysE family translocator [Candidatus Albibeggiatoa sp. nov. NOAA]|uniref:LysE family translocator n=1 Tax=Candidatus Albibeggiatoa sp. nov. NOAA TaxID=3162724 RepID=UPI0032F0FC8C|nr:LysE family translocator [Thiotrichaceae bacterium]